MKFLRFFKSRDLLFYRIIFILVSLCVLALLFNYNIPFMHPEVVKRDIPNVLKNGTALVPGDLLRGFDFTGIGGDPRVRFLSYAFQIVNVKFRVWLFHHFPPHPTLSLTWIFSLILSPILLFKLVYNLTENRVAAWVSISLYFLTTGFLSGLTHLFHPGKPLTNFFAIWCLYLASRVSRHVARGSYFSRKLSQSTLLLFSGFFEVVFADKTARPPSARYFRKLISKIGDYRKSRNRFSKKAFRVYLLLLGVLFLSFFCDETAWFIFIGVPVIFPALFGIRRRRARAAVLYLSTFAAFLLFVTFLAPVITGHLGYGTIDFWKYVSKPSYASSSKIWEQFEFKNIILNGRKFLTSQIVPARVPYSFHANRNDKYAGVFFSLYFLLVFIFLPRNQKKLFLRMVVVLALYIIFQTAILTKHLKLFSCSYYYGALFSVYFTLALSVLLSVKREPFKTLNKFILIFLLGIFVYNFLRINEWQRDIADQLYRHHFRKEEENQMQGRDLTRSMVLKAWNGSHDNDTLLKMKPEFPLRALWLFRELEYVPKRKNDNLLYKRKLNIPIIGDILTPGGVIMISDKVSPGSSVYNLIDGNPDTIWHVPLDQVGEPAWVKVDFGRGGNKVVRSLKARPRRDLPKQFFRNAVLSGSKDGKTWVKIAPVVQKEAPAGDELCSWNFENDQAFRYYKFLITDGHEGPAHHFYSMAELMMFE